MASLHAPIILAPTSNTTTLCRVFSFLFFCLESAGPCQADLARSVPNQAIRPASHTNAYCSFPGHSAKIVFNQPLPPPPQPASRSPALYHQVKQAQAERQADFVLEDASEVGDIRRELLQKSNELALVTVRDQELQRTSERLQTEKVELEKELVAMKEQRPSDMDPEIVQMKQDIAQTQQDILKRKSELEQLNAAHEDRKQQAVEAAAEEEKVVADVVELTATLAVEGQKPQRVAKQADHQFTHAIKSYKQQLSEATLLHDRLTKDLNAVDEQRAVLAQDASELAVVLDQETHKMGMSKRRGEQATLEVNLRKSDINTSLADNARLQGLNKMTSKETRRTDESIKRLTRDKDTGVRNLRSVGIKVAHIKQQVEGEASKLDVLHSAVKAKKQEGIDLGRAVAAASDDVKIIEQKCASRLMSVHGTKVELKDLKAIVEKSTLQAAQWQTTTNELSRDIRTKQHEVDQSIGRSMLQEATAARARDELGNKDAIVLDCKKSLRTIETQLKQGELVYQTVKNDKNKYVTDTANLHQRQMDMKEKIRTLHNEKETLNSQLHEKETKVHLQGQLVNTKYRAREKQRNALTVLRLKVEEIQKQTTGLKGAKQKQLDLLAVHKKKISTKQIQTEKALNERDAAGADLLDRHDELIRVYEKLSIYSRMIRSGDLKIQEREEQLRFLRLEVQELERGITLARSLQPEKERHTKELVETLEGLKETQEKVQRLEKKIESPNDGDRNWRELEGPEPTQAELLEKVDVLQERLVAKEEICLEKELILKETARLTDRARTQVAAGRNDTLSLARTVNDHQAKIKDVSRKLMANLSELSMYHGMCIKREQEMNTLQETVKEADVRLEQGTAPTHEMGTEWKRMERRLEQEADEREMQELGMTVEEDGFGTRALAGGNRTFADLRPNAYIPNGPDDLPVPKPYGRDAPFKPSQPSAHFRHFRRTVKQTT